MTNIKTYKKMINTANTGDRYYINFINCPLSFISYTRELLKDGKIKVDMDEIVKAIKPEAIPQFITGECLLPQQTFIIAK